MEEEAKLTELEKIRWKNRRRMAWTSLVSMIIFTLLVMFVIPAPRLDLIAEMLSWYYFAAASVTGAYMGLATWAEIKKN